MKTISLELPFAAENLLIARLTLSGACTRLNIDIWAIENAKVALTEACMLLASKTACGRIRIVFTAVSEDLLITAEALDTDTVPFEDESYDEEFSLLMLNALAADVTLQPAAVSFTVLRS